MDFKPKCICALRVGCGLLRDYVTEREVNTGFIAFVVREMI